MKIEIDINEGTIIEGIMSEIDSGMIEASILGHLENTNFAEFIDTDDLFDEDNVNTLIEDFMSNMDLSDYIDVSDYIDTSDIRYDIEDDILEQVNDHLDYDTIRYNIEDEIVDSCWSNFDIDNILDYDTIKEGLEYEELEDRVEALENQLEELQASFDSITSSHHALLHRKACLIRRVFGWLW